MELYRKLVDEAIRFKSVSTDEAFLPDIQKTAERFIEKFKERGFETNLVTGYDNPIVFSSYTVDPAYETCLIYGHYDVQPADMSDGRDSDPFEVTERDGRLYGRGIIDNKGQVLVHIATIFDLIEKGELKYNVKFFIEGNEETGSPNLRTFVEENTDLLSADFIMISDGEVTGEYPTIDVGYRGIFNATVKVRTSSKELHSGLYGGCVPNASQVLVDLLADVYDEDHMVTIPGFGDGIEPVDPSIIENNKKIPYGEEDLCTLTGCSKILHREGLDFYTQTGLYTSVEITGMQSGYTGVGYKNAVPDVASAKFNVRLPAQFDPAVMFEKFKRYIEEKSPNYAEVEVIGDQMSKGVLLGIDNIYVKHAVEVFERVYEKPIIYKYCGATIPVVTDFDEIFGVPQVLAPLINDDCRMHATNENFDMRFLEKALAFSRAFFGA